MAWIENAIYETSDFKLRVARWDFPDEGVSCIFGESGSGKTTLLQIMAGLIPSQYRLCVKGEILSELPVKFRNIGFVFQDYALFPHMTVLENIAFAAEAKSLSLEMWQDHGMRLMSELSLKNLAHQKAAHLSGGEQQRVALARALVTKPKIVLMDEPFSALDEDRREDARDLILQLSSEFRVPFILVTHDIRDVRKLSQNIILLKNGLVLECGPTSQVLEHPQTLEAAYAMPENQVVELDGHFLVAKSWSFRMTDTPNPSLQKLRGVILNITNDGPNLICKVRLSNGQIIRAMAPLNTSPQGEVELEYDSKHLVTFKRN